MKVYRELSISGNLNELKKEIDSCHFKDWTISKYEGYDDLYKFEYSGPDKLSVDIAVFTGNSIQWDVTNIVPVSDIELTMDQYNDILMYFFSNVVKQFKTSGLKFYGPTKDSKTIDDYMNETTKELLLDFIYTANRSTGTSHPSDQHKWFDFIIEAYKSKSFELLDGETLLRILIEEYSWPEDIAIDLQIEYEKEIRLLMQYDGE